MKILTEVTPEMLLELHDKPAWDDISNFSTLRSFYNQKYKFSEALYLIHGREYILESYKMLTPKERYDFYLQVI